MNPKQLIRISNIIGIVAIVLLIYWIFTFILIEVFGLKVFRQNMTESFYFSVLGILALLIFLSKSMRIKQKRILFLN